MDPTLVTLLAAGGDLATIALLVVMWRFDRRLLALEIWRGHNSETR